MSFASAMSTAAAAAAAATAAAAAMEGSEASQSEIEKTKARVASCSCGGFKIHLQGEPIRVSVCHCFACQQRTGSVFGVQARFHESQITGEEGEFKTYTRVGDAGSVIHFKFCPNCGSTLSWTFDGGVMPGIVAVAVGSLADPTIGTPIFSVYEARKHPWVQLPEGIEHWD